jgi:hypothetical protein
VTFELDDTFALLERTPVTLPEQPAGMPTASTESRPDADNWSVYQVVCHLAYLNHVRQVQEAMAFRYADEACLWRVNLGVPDRSPA